MKYTAELLRSSSRVLTITDEQGELVGYLIGFGDVLNAIDFMGMINGSKLPIEHFPKGNLEALEVAEVDGFDLYHAVQICTEDETICYVDDPDFKRALELAEALVKQGE